jgi:hypothetical protein
MSQEGSTSISKEIPHSPVNHELKDASHVPQSYLVIKEEHEVGLKNYKVKN